LLQEKHTNDKNLKLQKPGPKREISKVSPEFAEFENIGGTMNKQIDLLNDLCMKPEVIVTKKGKIEVDITKGDF